MNAHVRTPIGLSGPLETKDAGDDPGLDTAEIKKQISEFMTTFTEFHKKVDDELKEQKKSIDGMTADAVTADEVKKLNEALDEQKKLIEDLRLAEKRPLVEMPGGVKRMETEEETEYNKKFHDWFRTGDGESEVKSAQKKLLEAKDLSVGIDPSGGYLAPAQMDTIMDRILSEVSPVRSVAQVMNISANSYTKPFNRGGALTGWVGETGSRAKTGTPVIDELDFPAMELYAMPAATQTLLDDAVVNIESWLANEVGIVFAEQEGAAFVNGDGVKQPRGFLNYTKVIDTSWAWGKIGYVVTGASGAFKTTAAGDDHDNIIDLVYALKTGFRGNARFAANRSTMGTVRKMKDADGNPYWQPNFALGEPPTLAGYPLTEMEDMPAIAANSFSMAFGDFRRSYLIVDRIGVRVLRDPYTSKPYILFYTTKRVGGGIQNFEPLKLLKFGTS